MDESELARFFLRGIWAHSIPDDMDTSWVERVAEMAGHEQEPLGDFGPLVKRMLSAGVTPAEIARFAKIVGYETAFGFCCHLEDPTDSYEGFDDEPEEVAWGLFEIDVDSGLPVRSFGALHEEILSLDPSGREMRPPPAAPPTM